MKKAATEGKPKPRGSAKAKGVRKPDKPERVEPAVRPAFPGEPGADRSRRLQRKDLPSDVMWRLEDIFRSDADWEKSLESIPRRVQEVREYQGRLAISAGHLAEALDLEQHVSMTLMEIFSYARMRRDENNGDSNAQGMADRAMNQYFEVSTALAFIAPEVAKIPAKTLRQWVNDTPRLAPYRHILENMIRNRKHTKSFREEQLLSMAGPVSEGISTAFTMLDNVDLRFGTIRDETGQEVEMTHGRFGIFRESRSREVRKAAFETIHKAYAGMGNTLGALYAASVKSDIFFQQARGHTSTLSAALFADNLPESIYTGLLDAVHEFLPELNRYYGLRKKWQKLEALHLYDCYVPLVDVPDREYPFSQACEMVREGLRPLGEEYGKALDRLLTERWIDVYETEGKTSGAYAWGTYKTHPYMLLNYSGRLSDIFTLAHEAGHCLHSYFSDARQTFANSHYPIFLAEIASTVNENLLVRHLLDRCDPSTREGRLQEAYLLNHYIEEFKGTVFRQAMFAEFEWDCHQHAESGQPLTPDFLCGFYSTLLSQYFGPEVVIDDFMHWEWARIPHFYNAYYVFKYATGFSAATALSRAILEQGAVAPYLEFLSAGGSEYPLDTLRRAGVDMSRPEPVRLALETFSAMVRRFEALMEKEEALGN